MELMDDPCVDAVEHARALSGLRRINAISGVVGEMSGRALRWLRGRSVDGAGRVRMLDIASGGGDVALGIASRLKREGYGVELSMLDQAELGLRSAVERACGMGIEARALVGNVFDGLPEERYDLVTCTLFLHHFDPPEVERLLGLVGRARPGLLLVSDLRRSWAGWWAARVGGRILSRSRLVHHDGPASVRAAYTREEMQEMADRSGLVGARVEEIFPWRLSLEWRGG